MGLPVDRTKFLVYTFNGFCSALAGLSLALFVESGHGLYANGFELDVIASVVMGGTMLTGGSGYVFGTLFGVMVYAVTQVLIQFIGSLSSWWTKIVIGALTLIFIGVQTALANRKSCRAGCTAHRSCAFTTTQAEESHWDWVPWLLWSLSELCPSPEGDPPHRLKRRSRPNVSSRHSVSRKRRN
jgi:hypothetical protein